MDLLLVAGSVSLHCLGKISKVYLLLDDGDFQSSLLQPPAEYHYGM